MDFVMVAARVLVVLFALFTISLMVWTAFFAGSAQAMARVPEAVCKNPRGRVVNVVPVCDASTCSFGVHNARLVRGFRIDFTDGTQRKVTGLAVKGWLEPTGDCSVGSAQLGITSDELKRARLVAVSVR